MIDKIAFVLFFAFCLGVYSMHLNTNVDVHVCEDKGLTTYVSKQPPHSTLKVGACHLEPKTNSGYYELRRSFKSVRK